MGLRSSQGLIDFSDASYPPVAYDATLSFEHPALVAALAYWRRQCGDRTMPRRAAIDPRGMKDFLTHVGLVEVLARPGEPIDYFVRVAGQDIEDVLGPRTGRSLTAALPPVLAARWRDGFDRVRELKKPLRATTRVAFENKTWLAAENLCAPISEDGSRVSMMLVGFVAVRKPDGKIAAGTEMRPV
jgi:hypothetical protein